MYMCMLNFNFTLQFEKIKQTQEEEVNFSGQEKSFFHLHQQIVPMLISSQNVRLIYTGSYLSHLLANLPVTPILRLGFGGAI